MNLGEKKAKARISHQGDRSSYVLMGISLYKFSGECIAHASGSCRITIYNLAQRNVKAVYQ
jgi:hypothetical protein